MLSEGSHAGIEVSIATQSNFVLILAGTGIANRRDVL